MFTFKRNKKGTLDLSLENLIGLILTLLILVALFFILVKIYTYFTGKDIDQPTLDNFERLSDEIDKLIGSGEEYAIVPYYIRGTTAFLNYYILAGFNKNDMWLEQTCGAFDKQLPRDSARCHIYRSCLCLLDNEKKTKKCYVNKTINKFVVDSNYLFDMPFQGKRTDGQYHGLVVWGSCKQYNLIPRVWYVRTLYIKKEVLPNNEYNIIFGDLSGTGFSFGGVGSNGHPTGGAGASGSW